MFKLNAVTVQTENSKWIVLTSPHAACDRQSTIRQCDLNAEDANNSLARNASSYNVKQFIYTDVNMPRSVVDMNRPESTNTIFRHNLRNYLESIENKNNVVLIDVHSYPRYHQWPGVPSNTKLVILDNINGRYDWRNIANALHSYEVVYVSGSISNDIVNEARVRFGIDKSVIFEYREDLTISELDQLNQHVMKILNKFLI